MSDLEELLSSTFDSRGIATASLRCIATADLKKDEPGIQELAAKYGVPVLCYTAPELNSVFEGTPENEKVNPPSPPLVTGGSEEISATGAIRRPRVRDLLGMWGVSEPAALLASGSRQLLVPRVKTNQATIAVCRVEFGSS